MKSNRRVGIAGFGAYVPRFRIRTKQIAEVWRAKRAPDLLAIEKSVPGVDEDVVTMAIEAARTALRRSGLSALELGAIWLGSESSPYALKPSATIVGAAVGASTRIMAADLQFAGKAGSEAMQNAIGAVGSGMVGAALAIGVDAAKARPGDVLELTAACGGAAFVFAPAEQSIAVVEGSTSYVTDTLDVFRRHGAAFPNQTGKFGDQAYLRHTMEAARQLMQELRVTPDDFSHAVFHQPHPKGAERVARGLGFTKQQVELGHRAAQIGNAYAGSALLGLAAILDRAEPGQKVLFCSYGAGAGSDAIAFTITGAIGDRRDSATVERYLNRRHVLNYGEYLRMGGMPM